MIQSLQRSFSYLKPTVLDKLDAHCLDKRAYLCRLLRRLEGDWIRFPAVSKARRGAVGSRTQKTHTHETWGVSLRTCLVECKIELTFVKLGAAYYGMLWWPRGLPLPLAAAAAAYRRRLPSPRAAPAPTAAYSPRPPPPLTAIYRRTPPATPSRPHRPS